MSFLSLTLKTELTCIPNIIHELLGTGFNNTLCNGITWLLIFWFIVHSFYLRLIYLLLKQFCFSTYERHRLAASLWNLTIYGYFLSYYLRNKEMEYFSNFKSVTEQNDIQPTVTLFAVLCSFHMFTGFWKGMEQNSLTAFLRSEVFAFVCIAAYMLDYWCFLLFLPVVVYLYPDSFLGLYFTMTALVSVSVIFQELSRVSYMLLRKPKKVAKVFILALFAWTVLYFSITYFVAIPIVFILPIGAQILAGRLDLIPFLVALLIWLGLSGYNSITHKLITHWAKHLKLTEDNDNDFEVKKQDHECLGNMLECALFPPRQDVAYILSIYRSEAKYRQKQMVAKRKPKNKNMIIQTLKCMMAIKRKLCEKKANQTITEDNIDQKETDETPNIEESSSDAIKRSDKHFKLLDASSASELRINEETEIEKKEDETEISDELLFDDTHVDTDDLACTNISDTLKDRSDLTNSGEAAKLDHSLSEGVN